MTMQCCNAMRTDADLSCRFELCTLHSCAAPEAVNEVVEFIPKLGDWAEHVRQLPQKTRPGRGLQTVSEKILKIVPQFGILNIHFELTWKNMEKRQGSNALQKPSMSFSCLALKATSLQCFSLRGARHTCADRCCI